MTPASDLPVGLEVLERGWLSANGVLFTGGEQTVLVDSGYCTHSDQTLQLVADLLGARPLDQLVNTHLHSDHCGGNAALQARYLALRTLIPPGQAPHVADWDPVALTYQPTGQQCPAFGFEGTLQAGTDRLLGTRRWQVHAAPGHDPHAVVFFEPGSRTLISGDALWENGFGVVFPELEGEQAFDAVDATLDLIERLQPKVVIPGHGPVFAYGQHVLARSRQRLDAFVADPRKHAQHAVKVLLKFKLLEVQRHSWNDFQSWAQATPYMELIRQRFFADELLGAWLERLTAELMKAGAVRRDGDNILNA